MKFCSLLLFFFCSFSSYSQTDSTSVLDFMVYDAKTGEPIIGYNFMMSGTDGSEIDRVISSSSSPEKFSLKVGFEYEIIISIVGYISTTDGIDTNPNCFGAAGGTTYMKEYFLEPVTCCKCCHIPAILFDFQSHKLKETSHYTLEIYKEILNENPELGLEIRGFISPKEHFSLSVQRATVVKTWLTENGIKEERLSIWWNAEEVKELKSKSNIPTQEVIYYQTVLFSITKY